jgi:hypothetical protein
MRCIEIHYEGSENKLLNPKSGFLLKFYYAKIKQNYLFDAPFREKIPPFRMEILQVRAIDGIIRASHQVLQADSKTKK